jgi:PilZ domain-containing protein
MSQLPPVALDKTDPAARKAERRVSVRFQSNAKGHCQSVSLQRESAWEAIVRDISCSGIGLLLPRRFERGTLLTIELTETTAGQTRLLLVRVVHATPQPEGNWLLGCALTNSLTEDEVQLLSGNTP